MLEFRGVNETIKLDTNSNNTTEPHGVSSRVCCRFCMCAMTRKRANVCENREQSRKHRKDSKWQREMQYEKIEAKLYVIKGYREPLKKPHIYANFFSLPQRNKIHNNKNVAAMELCNTPSDRTKSCNKIHLLFRETRREKSIVCDCHSNISLSLSLFVFVRSLLLSPNACTFPLFLSILSSYSLIQCINNVASVSPLYSPLNLNLDID